MTEQFVIDILCFLFRDIACPIIYYSMMSLMLTPKYNRALTIMGLAVYNILVQYSVSDLPVYIYTLSYVLVLMVPALVFYKEKKWVCATAGIMIFFFIVACDLLMSTIVLKSIHYYTPLVRPYTWVSAAVQIVGDTFMAAVFIPVLVLWNKVIKKCNSKSLSLFTMFPLGQAIFIAACTYPTWDESGAFYDVFDNPLMLLAVVISLISDILMLVALRDNDKFQTLRYRVSEMEKEMEVQLQYYDALADKFTEIREYRHDINNLVSVAESLINENSPEYSKNFIGDMKAKAESMAIPFFCGNKIVNAVLWKKRQEAERLGVSFTVGIERGEAFPLDNTDVCSLFANLIDNAIRGAAEVGDGSVTVTAGRQHGMLVIHITNSVSRDLPETTRPKTTKRGDHGYGLEIVDKIARKYNGTFILKSSEGTAHAMVSLMMEQTQKTPESVLTF